MKISTKIILVSLVPLCLLGIISIAASMYSVNTLGKNEIAQQARMLRQEKEEKLRDLVRNTTAILEAQYSAANDPKKVARAYLPELRGVIETAISSVEAVYARTDLDEAAKKKLALNLIEKIRYGKNGYIWVNNSKPTMVMHPMKPALNGKDLSGFADPNGKKLFVEMAKICKAEGKGSVDYMWAKPGHDKPVAKTSYVQIFKPWDWILGTGVYLEVAEDHFKEEAKKSVASLRYGEEGKDYFFILGNDLKTVMHPIKPALNGQDMSNFKDPDGKKLFAEMAQVSEREGQGFVDYKWAKPGHDEPVRKLSYVQLFKPWGWIVGTGVYLDDIDRTIAAAELQINKTVASQRNMLLLTILSLLIITVFILMVFSKRISAPILKTSAMLRDISEGEGDLTGRISVETKDEVGQLGQWFNAFIKKLQAMIGDIGNDAITLHNSVKSLSNLSAKLSTGAEETSAKATTVATAAEEMSANMNSISGAMEESSTSVELVSVSLSEMTSTIDEIAENSEKARAITAMAVDQVNNASKEVESLGTSAQEIGKVLESITEISDQTNLLALNATIEAARAGEAGKGFAVVANEIKELAKQTADATGDIREKIESIQQSTEATVTEISNINGVVNKNSSIVATIASAVEEQSATAREISDSMDQMAMGIQEINENVGQSSTVAHEIATDIASVNQASEEINRDSDAVDSNAESMRLLSERLSGLVKTFKV